MRASARIVAEADGDGRTRLTVLHGESPLLLRRTGPRAAAAGVVVHLVGGAAGPLRGDELSLEVTVGPGADLEVRSVAAQLALPGRTGLPPSRLTIRATVAEGASLRWLPEPLIAAAGCEHATVTEVDVAEGGRLLWRDDLVCGRHDEPSGDVRIKTTLRYAGSTLYRHDLAVGPHAPGWAGAAVLGGGRALGTLVAAAHPLGSASPAQPTATSPAQPTATPPTGPRSDAALMPLAGPGLLATVVGADIRQVRAALDPLCRPPGRDAADRPRPEPVPA